MNDTAPRSFLDATGGLLFFTRMLDKIRLHARGELREDCHKGLGMPLGGDGRCCDFLRVDYSALKARVLEGGTDEEILEWCYATGRRPGEMDISLWNDFVRKLGWNDAASRLLKHWKADAGLADRDDLVTIADFTDVLEGRKP
jgi:hypothetical protein